MTRAQAGGGNRVLARWFLPIGVNFELILRNSSGQRGDFPFVWHDFMSPRAVSPVGKPEQKPTMILRATKRHMAHFQSLPSPPGLSSWLAK